jgi:hypothetical protein
MSEHELKAIKVKALIVVAWALFTTSLIVGGLPG